MLPLVTGSTGGAAHWPSPSPTAVTCAGQAETFTVIPLR